MHLATRLLGAAALALLASGSAHAAAILNLYVSDGDTDSTPCENSVDCDGPVNLLAPGVVTFDIFISPGSEGFSSYGMDVVTAGAGTPFGAAGSNGPPVVQSTTNRNVPINIAPPDPDADPPVLADPRCPTGCSLTELGVPVYGADRVNGFNLATFGTGPISGTFRVGRATFTFNQTGTASLANLVFYDNAGQAVTVTGLSSIVVNVVPEPGTLLLLGAGLAGLTVLGRRRA